MTSVSFGGWNFPLHRVVDDRVGTSDGVTPGLQRHSSLNYRHSNFSNYFSLSFFLSDMSKLKLRQYPAVQTNYS